MGILQISRDHHVVGGSDRVFFETWDLLAQGGARGHSVLPE